MGTPRCIKEVVSSLSRTDELLAEYLMATDRSVVVDMGASSVPPLRKKSLGTFMSRSPRQ